MHLVTSVCVKGYVDCHEHMSPSYTSKSRSYRLSRTCVGHEHICREHPTLRILPKCTSYTKGLKGHPKVNNNENFYEVKLIKRKRKAFQKCEKFCNERNDCVIYAVNDKKAKPPRCHLFTYEHLDKKLINWDKNNDNMNWVS